MKPADSGQIAKAREFYNKLAKDYEDDLEPDETFEFAAAFAESKRQAVIEECCRAVCHYCASPDRYEFFNTETRKHRHFETGQHFGCRATAIRSME